MFYILECCGLVFKYNSVIYSGGLFNMNILTVRIFFSVGDVQSEAVVAKFWLWVLCEYALMCYLCSGGSQYPIL